MSQVESQRNDAERQRNWCFIIAFSFALDELFLNHPALGWSDDECKQPNVLRGGGKITWKCRMIQDRFARVFQDCRLPGSLYEQMKQACFFDAPLVSEHKDCDR